MAVDRFPFFRIMTWSCHLRLTLPHLVELCSAEHGWTPVSLLCRIDLTDAYSQQEK